MDFDFLNSPSVEIEEVENLFRNQGVALPLSVGSTHYLINKKNYAPPEIVSIKQTRHKNYYVCVDTTDKRLDRWVDISYLRPISLFSSASSVRRNSSSFSPSITSLTRKSFVSRTLTRRELLRQNEELEPSSTPYEISYNDKTSVKNISNIFLHNKVYKCWWYSPFPESFSLCKVLYFCERCLLYFKTPFSLKSHYLNCFFHSPPGEKIYDDPENSLGVWEVDPTGNTRVALYCQCLCLLAKLFLKRKTLFYDVTHFLFYLAVKVGSSGHELLGFFSKEKKNPNNNLSCILVLPGSQNGGLGKFLVGLSYYLSRRDGLVAGPEKPISDLGRLLYRGFWAEECFKVLLALRRYTTVLELEAITGIPEEHIKNTFEQLELIRFYKGHSVIPFEEEVILKYAKVFIKKKSVKFVESCVLEKYREQKGVEVREKEKD